MNQPIPDPQSQAQSNLIQDTNFRGDLIFAPVQIGTKIETQIVQISVAKVTQQQLIKTSPYQGLKKFNFQDRERFFGRDKLIARLFEAVNSSSNLSLVLGASGSGKSSVVRTGLIPELKKSLESQIFYDFIFTPNQDPFDSLYRCLLSEEKDYSFNKSQAEIALKAQADTLTEAIGTLKKNEERWLIFIDQFEELFAICQDPEKCKNFIEGIVRVAKSGDSSIKIILAMRADFVERLSSYPDLGAIANQNNIHLVTEMYPDELRQAIEQPAARYGVVFEKGLVEQIIKEVEGQKGFLPLLQYTLNLLWESECKIIGADHYIQHQGHQLALTDVIFSRDGKTIASSSWDNTVNVWSLDGSYGTSLGSSKFKDLVWSISESPDGKAIAVANGNEIQIIRYNGKKSSILKGHSKIILLVTFSPDGQTIASGSEDGTVKLWNLDGKELKTLKHDNEVTDVSFSPDGQTILTAGMDGLKLWNLSGQFLSQFGGKAQKSEEFTGAGLNIEFSQDTKFLTVVKVIENSPAKKAGIKVGDVILAIDGNPTTGMSLDENINLLRGEAGTKVVLKIVRQGNNTFDVTVIRDIIKTVESGGIRYKTAKFSSDSQIIAAGSGFPDRGTVKLWSRDGRLLKTLKGHKKLVWDVSFSPNGKMLASASEDKTVKLWSIDGEELRTFKRDFVEFRS
ncbi:MAG: WD40 repeat domain-containing protein [Oscillatoriaceae cyanobacterium Prado104]|jgi:WD40 repeat protein|nr:WD40 repeat domain-containing protein [Oscillatoriaceae cyanobacterium Prado104]